MSDGPDGGMKQFVNQFEAVLREMNQAGGYRRSVLATDQGLPVATAPMPVDQESATALVALLGQVSVQVRSELEMAPLDEVALRADDRTHLVCRTVDLGEDYLILGVLVPPGTPYRRETNRAVSRIRELVLS